MQLVCCLPCSSRLACLRALSWCRDLGLRNSVGLGTHSSISAPLDLQTQFGNLNFGSYGGGTGSFENASQQQQQQQVLGPPESFPSQPRSNSADSLHCARSCRRSYLLRRPRPG